MLKESDYLKHEAATEICSHMWISRHFMMAGSHCGCFYIKFFGHTQAGDFNIDSLVAFYV